VGVPNNGQYQSSYALVDLGVTRKSASDLWEVRVTGKNITDEVVAADCVDVNVRSGLIFGGQTTGGTTPGPAGPEPSHLLCGPRAGSLAQPGCETLRPSRVRRNSLRVTSSAAIRGAGITVEALCGRWRLLCMNGSDIRHGSNGRSNSGLSMSFNKRFA
jgi:hypothetical protein